MSKGKYEEYLWLHTTYGPNSTIYKEHYDDAYDDDANR
jgi:hypothetical protein